MLCSAPFEGLLVDPNKQVRPCCVYKGTDWGNIKTSSIQDILNHPDRLKLQDDMKNWTWNPGCSACKISEEQTGRSVRKGNFNNTLSSTIQYLEYNGSNICNLTCAMCNPFFSSAWVDFNRKHNILKITDITPSVFADRKIHGPNVESSSKFFKQLDLTSLKTLVLKGGEPFLNKENIVLLEHLQEIDILKNVHVTLVTNGTVVNQDMLNLLKIAKSLSVTLSKDGPNDINRWIRWSDTHPDLSTDSNIKNNIQQLLSLPNIKHLKNTFSLQVYNVFRLEEHRTWWEEEIVPLHTAVKNITVFDYIVFTPQYNIRVLTDITRQQLIKKYKQLNVNGLYNPVIHQLELPYAGNSLHDSFVEHLIKLDKTRDVSILDIVPELAAEIQIYSQNRLLD